MKRQIKFMDRKTLLRNILTTALILGFSTAVSFAFYRISGNAENVPAFYMLAVVFIARFTTGYVPGIAAALISVVCVNYAFTYPYFSLAFNLDGYPVTFASMLIIACLTSMTTTHLKEKNRILREQEKLLMEAEKEKMRANLLRAVSHDLRTPLTSIIGASSTYLENGAFLSEGEKLQMVQTIYDDSNWLLHMVENLLSVTKIRQDGARLTKTLEASGGGGVGGRLPPKKADPGRQHPGDHPGKFHHGAHGCHPHRAGDHQPPGKRHLPQRFHRTPGADCLNRGRPGAVSGEGSRPRHPGGPSSPHFRRLCRHPHLLRRFPQGDGNRPLHLQNHYSGPRRKYLGGEPAGRRHVYFYTSTRR